MTPEHQLTTLLILGIGYLLGSIPSGYLAGRLFAGIDLREKGSGSTGATNVLRHVGKKAALIVFIIDVSKGIAAVLIAKLFNLNEIFQVATGITSLAGHIWPIWLRWRGGKAVATGLGIFLGLSWQVGLASLGIFLSVLSITRIVSLSSVISSVSLPILMVISFQGNNSSPAYIIVSIIAMGLVIWRHRSNLRRLIAGTEPKLGQSN